MKINFMRCDICNTKYEEGTGIHMDVQLSSDDGIPKHHDLIGIDICPICRTELTNWLEDLKNGRGED
jgi:hypothetical protein